MVIIMSRLSYNDVKVNRFVDDVYSLKDKLDELNIDCKNTIEMIVNAKGFNQYISNVDANCFDPYFEESSFAFIDICESVRYMQSEILLFNGDKDSIKMFLNSLSEKELANCSDELKDIYSKMTKRSTSILERTGATIFTSAISAVEGILDLVETVIDLGDLALTGIGSVFVSAGDFVSGTYNTDESSVNKMFEDCKARVSKKHVESLFNSFYDETKFGNSLRDKSYFFEQNRNISKGISQSMGIVGAGILTGGASVAAGSLSAGRLAGVAGTIAFSTNTEDAWANGASVGAGLKRGLAGAVWDGAQWFVGAKIGAPNGYGDKLAKNLFKSTSKGAIAASRIGLDAVDSGLEGFVQPLLDLMYKDSYIDENGETVLFDSNMTFADKYREVFDDAGGMNNVLVQGAIGAGGSAIGEISDMTTLLKPEGEGKIDLDAGAKTVAGAAGLSLTDKVRSIFKSDVDLDTRVETDIDVSLRDVDSVNGRVDVDSTSRVGVDTDSLRYGDDLFESDVSIRKTDSDVTLDNTQSRTSVSSFDDGNGVADVFNSSDKPFSLDFRDADGRIIDYNEVDVKTSYADAPFDSTYSTKKNVLESSLTSVQRQHLKTLDDIMVAGGKDSGLLSSSTIKKQLTNFEPKVIAAYIENNSSNVDFTMQLVGALEGKKLSQVVSHVMTTPSSMSVIGTFNTFQILECLDNLPSTKSISDFSVRLSDGQIAKTINDLSFRLESDGRYTFDGYDINDTLKKLTPLANRARLQRLLNNNSFARPDICKKVLNDSVSSGSRRIYDMSMSDYDSYGRLSKQTRDAIKVLDASDSAKLIESSFGMNKPLAVYEIIDSIDANKLPSVMKYLKDTQYERMVIDRLKGSQVSSIVQGLDTLSACDFISKLTDGQAEYVLKGVASTSGKLSFSVMESLLDKMDVTKIDSLISNGYLDKYFGSLDYSHLQGSVLEKYCIYSGRDGLSVKNVFLLTSESVKTVQSAMIDLKNGKTSLNLKGVNDIKAITALLNYVSSSPTSIYSNIIIKDLDFQTKVKVFQELISSQQAFAAKVINSLDNSNSYLVFHGLSDHFKDAEFFLKNVSKNNFDNLLSNGFLDRYVSSLKPEQVSASCLSKNIIRIFDNKPGGYPPKYMLFTNSQLNNSKLLINELDLCIKSGKFSAQFDALLTSFDDKTFIKLVDDLIVNKKRSALAAQVFDRLDSSRKASVLKVLIDFDGGAGRNFISKISPRGLSELFFKFSDTKNSKYFDLLVENASFENIENSLKLVDISIKSRICGSEDYKLVSKANIFFSDSSNLREYISRSSDAQLTAVLNRLSTSKFRDGKFLANKLLTAIDSNRMNLLVDSGKLKYNSFFSKDVNTRLLQQSCSGKMHYFDDLHVAQKLYGVDQGINDSFAGVRVGDFSDIDKDALCNFLQHEGSFTEASARKFVDGLEKGKPLPIRHQNLIKKFIIMESGGSPELALKLNRSCFSRKAHSSYIRVIDKLCSHGISKMDAVRMIDTFNTSAGACSYADVCNVIVDSYRGSPELFERDFGFPLYTEVNGKKSINSLELMSDIFITLNSDKYGGKIFVTAPDGSLKFASDTIDSKSQIYMSSYSEGIRTKIIEPYLKSKNPNLSLSVEVSCYSHLNNFNSSPIAIEGLKAKIANALKDGKSVSLGLYNRNNRAVNFMMESDSGLVKYVSTSTWGEGGAHAVFVTGITDEHIIISSWGNKYYLPLVDFYNNHYNISISSIGGIK